MELEWFALGCFGAMLFVCNTSGKGAAEDATSTEWGNDSLALFSRISSVPEVSGVLTLLLSSSSSFFGFELDSVPAADVSAAYISCLFLLLALPG